MFFFPVNGQATGGPAFAVEITRLVSPFFKLLKSYLERYSSLTSGASQMGKAGVFWIVRPPTEHETTRANAASLWASPSAMLNHATVAARL